MHKTLLLAMLAASVVVPTSCFAGGTPAQLRGKSIVVNWSEDRLQRRAGEGDFRPRHIPQTLSVYASVEGRLFSRRGATGGGRRAQQGSRDSVGQEGKVSGGTVRVSAFRGHTLSVTAGLDRGARAIALTFDDNFSSCTAHVIVAREAGAKIMRVKSLVTGEMIEIQSTSASGASCSIQNGNVFAN